MSQTTPYRDMRMLRAAREVSGAYTITPVAQTPGAYTVTGGSQPYTVQGDPNWKAEPTCTCPDATRRNNTWCKHVMAVFLKEPTLRCQLIDLFLE